MSGSPSEALYSPSILNHAVSLANYPLDDAHTKRAYVTSRVCGSALELGLEVAEHQAIAGLGMRAKACAIGQASAAIFAAGARSKTSDDVTASLREIDAWLAGDGPLPDWPQIGDLAAALPHSGRHEAIRLPWRAAIAALCNDETAR
ncbi:iron-sulfur cluster assembly scaffold protein [Qipengyuania sp. DGS5-3]|uniref:iron-sulfur cluster assembly scaffold protein n=1 Tax=Qipengyuania sp. DGS5-3 TaxID=3349632 RepID=UPI0036D3F472